MNSIIGISNSGDCYKIYEIKERYDVRRRRTSMTELLAATEGRHGTVSHASGFATMEP